jgi:hypothetical protein
VGNKETLHGATETLVKIQNSTIHVYENHVVIEKKTIKHSEGKDNKDCQIDTHQATRLLLEVVVVEPEIVSKGPRLVYTIQKEDYKRI